MTDDTKSKFLSTTDTEWLEAHLDELFLKEQDDPFCGRPPDMTFEQGLRAWQRTVSTKRQAPWWSGVVAAVDGSGTCRADDSDAKPDGDGDKKPKKEPKNASRQQGSKDGEEQTENCERCGPDVTEWLVGELNKNKNHPAIQTMRENKDWVVWIPFFNLGYIYGFLSDFRELVRSGGPWDYKASQTFRSANCPAGCTNTVTLCGDCFFYDVPGNIHYGWVGRAAGLRAWFLHNRAAAAQAGGVDDPKDTQAIDIGINMWDSPDNGNIAYLCPRVRMKRNNLALRNCPICTEVYSP